MRCGPEHLESDTNIWISFLISRELQNLKDLIVKEKVKLITSDQLISELAIVTSREKFTKYFSKDKVADLISLLEIISEKVSISRIERARRDPKDDFLLALSKKSKADYLLTGDKDLLAQKVYGGTEILTAKLFKDRFK